MPAAENKRGGNKRSGRRGKVLGRSGACRARQRCMRPLGESSARLSSREMARPQVVREAFIRATAWDGTAVNAGLRMHS